MRPNRLKLGAIAAWFGLMALGFNALIPIQLAFGLGLDLAHARECGYHEPGSVPSHGASWWALALLTGHDNNADPSQSHNGLHPTLGPVCSAFGTPGGFAVATAATLPAPARLEQVQLSIIVADNAPQPTPSAYLSRAPPSRTAETT